MTDGLVVRYEADIPKNAGSNLDNFFAFCIYKLIFINRIFSFSIKDLMDVSEERELPINV